jgi:hypothetical protein
LTSFDFPTFEIETLPSKPDSSRFRLSQAALEKGSLRIELCTVLLYHLLSDLYASLPVRC